MSPDMERLVGRAILDKDFRQKLLDDPEATLKDAGFNLTQEEHDGVVKQAKSRSTDPNLTNEMDAARNGGW